MARVDPQMSPREVEMIHVYPFKRVIQEAGLLGVMSSYNDYDGFPIQSSYYWLTTRLRGQMGFRGYVVSDSDAVEYLYTKHGTAKDMKEAVRQSVEAGLNVRCTFRSPDSYVLPTCTGRRIKRRSHQRPCTRHPACEVPCRIVRRSLSDGLERSR